MTYQLEWTIRANKEWEQLDCSIQVEVLKKLKQRLANPHIPADLLSGNLAGLYRLKFRKSGIRLIYKVQDQRLVVVVVAIGKRENLDAYKTAAVRLSLLKGEADER
jgi:mRNA interferase RelE/StbE